MHQSDCEYYAARAMQERELSQEARSAESADLHAKLARHYEKLSRELSQESASVWQADASMPDLVNSIS